MSQLWPSSLRLLMRRRFDFFANTNSQEHTTKIMCYVLSMVDVCLCLCMENEKKILLLVYCVIRIVLGLKLGPQSNNRRARQHLHLHLFATFIELVHGAFIMHERNERAYTSEPNCIRTFDAQTFIFNCSLDFMQNAVAKRRIELSCCCVLVCAFSRVRSPHTIIIIIFTFNATANACFVFFCRM